VVVGIEEALAIGVLSSELQDIVTSLVSGPWYVCHVHQLDTLLVVFNVCCIHSIDCAFHCAVMLPAFLHALGGRCSIANRCDESMVTVTSEHRQLSGASSH